jgi:hypothetical protein
MMARRLAMRATPMASTMVTARGQPFRNRADRERDRSHEHLDDFLAPRDTDGESDRRQA